MSGSGHQPLFAFALLCDRSVKPDGTAVESCVIITMPAILRREDWDTWLTGTAVQAMALLKPYPADLMVAYELSARRVSKLDTASQLTTDTLIENETASTEPHESGYSP